MQNQKKVGCDGEIIFSFKPLSLSFDVILFQKITIFL